MTNYNPNPTAAPATAAPTQNASTEATQATQAEPKAEKPTRAEEVRTERRRKRGSVNAIGNQRLAVDKEKLDPSFEHRWVKDNGYRVSQLHQQDWDPVPHQVVDETDGEGASNKKFGGVGEMGKPYEMVLMRKRKDWFEEDQAEKHEASREVDRQIKSGTQHQNQSQNPEMASEGGFYTPGGGNSI